MKSTSERKVATKAIILSRVSSKEQEEGYSIAAQKHRLQEYCTRKGLEIIRVFEFCESSIIPNRIKFMEAINFARSQKEIIAIVTDKVDRLQRSHREYNMLDELISREKIELHFYTENCIIHKYSSSQDRMMWNVHVMMAQNYVDSMSDNIKRSFAHKLRCGECIGMAPIGYLNAPGPNEEGRRTIVVDPERAPLIKRLFEEYSTGSYSAREMLGKAKEWGLTNSRGKKGHLNSRQTYDILRNPFYYGVMRIEKTGKLYPHIYPPIITKELFDVCQEVYNARKGKSFKYAGKEFIFRGLIKCATTGYTAGTEMMTRISPKGRFFKWTHLRVWKPENPELRIRVREEEVIMQIEEVFKALVIPRELLEQITGYLKKLVETERDLHKKRLNELKVANTRIMNRISMLTDSFLDYDISKEEYEIKKQELSQKRSEITQEIELYSNGDDNFRERQAELIRLASGAYDAFREANITEKRQLLNFVFLSLKLRGKKLEYSLRPPFSEFINLAKIDEWPDAAEEQYRLISTVAPLAITDNSLAGST